MLSMHILLLHIAIIMLEGSILVNTDVTSPCHAVSAVSQQSRRIYSDRTVVEVGFEGFITSLSGVTSLNGFPAASKACRGYLAHDAAPLHAAERPVTPSKEFGSHPIAFGAGSRSVPRLDLRAAEGTGLGEGGGRAASARSMTLTDISNSVESSPTANADTRAARSRTLALLGDAPTPTTCLVRREVTLEKTPDSSLRSTQEPDASWCCADCRCRPAARRDCMANEKYSASDPECAEPHCTYARGRTKHGPPC